MQCGGLNEVVKCQQESLVASSYVEDSFILRVGVGCGRVLVFVR